MELYEASPWLCLDIKGIIKGTSLLSVWVLEMELPSDTLVSRIVSELTSGHV